MERFLQYLMVITLILISLLLVKIILGHEEDTKTIRDTSVKMTAMYEERADLDFLCVKEVE